MPVKTFRAASLQDALEEIRREMGSEACVLETRQVRDGWKGWLGQSYVEVTAKVGDTSSVDINLQPDGREIKTDSRRSQYRPNPTNQVSVGDRANQPPTQQGLTQQGPTQHGPTQQGLTQHGLTQQGHGSSQPPGSGGDESPNVGQPRIYLGDQTLLPRRNNVAPNSVTPNSISPNNTAQFKSELPSVDLPDETQVLPSQLEAYRNELFSLGVCPITIDRWMNATISFAASMDDLIEQPWQEHLHRSVARELRFAGPIRIPPGSRHTVALVGPTGVGKTTTVAKLAAGFRLESKRRVGLVTIDTFRIAAVQQLKAYAEIMDLPMQVVETPGEMLPAIESLGDVDLVLIDTAGRSPRSDARIDQLVEMLRSAQPDETHLVLSATSSTLTIRSVLDGFAPARPTAAILTKLDETPSTAAIVSEITACDQHKGIPVSYLTNGQQVPDDIGVASIENLLARFLPSQVSLPQMDAA